MFWDSLTREEADEFYLCMKRIDEWVQHCEVTRTMNKKRKKEKLPLLEIDDSLDPPTEIYLRWDELSRKGWKNNMDA